MTSRKWAIAAFWVVPTLVLAASPPPQPEPANHPDWKAARTAGEASLKSTLIDPSSAEITYTSGYQWSAIKPFLQKRLWGWVACGTVNAKNRMGGYVGAQPFWMAVDEFGNASAGMADGTVTACVLGSPVPLQPELSSEIVPASVSAPVSVADEIAKLADLRAKGIITQAEFDAQKTKLLNR